MKALKVFLPIGIMAAGAATYFIVSNKNSDGAKKSAKASSKLTEIKNPKTGSYSFVSGFKDASTINVDMKYDLERYSFAVIEDEFPSESGDSHVGVIYGEDFTMQIEYATYYKGEDFSGLAKQVEEKYKGYESVMYGLNEGFKYIDGDNMCLVFPAANDEYSYVLITIIKSKDCDIDFRKLPEHPDVKLMLEKMQISIK